MPQKEQRILEDLVFVCSLYNSTPSGNTHVMKRNFNNFETEASSLIPNISAKPKRVVSELSLVVGFDLLFLNSCVHICKATLQQCVELSGRPLHWMGSNFTYFGTGRGTHCALPVKCLKRSFLGSNQLVTQKVDKFSVVK